MNEGASTAQKTRMDGFEHAPVAMLVADLSALAPRLDELRATAGADLGAYLRTHPDDVTHLASLVKIVDVNRESIRFFDVETREAVYAALQRRLDDRALALFADAVIEVDAGVTRLNCEAPLLGPHGEEMLVDVGVSVVASGDARLASAIVSLVDITARRRAEEALGYSEERFRLAADLMGIATWDNYPLTGDNRWDERSRALYWMTPDEPVTYESFEARLHPDDRARVRENFEGALDPSSGGRYTIEFRLVGPAGEERHIRGSAQVFHDRGRPIRVLGAALDITERKKNEERLRTLLREATEADQHKNDFLAVLSHELRNPLAPIRNSLFVLDRAAPGSEQARRAQTVIGRQVAQLTRLVDDLLDVTRIARGKVQLQRERLELGDLVRQAMTDYRTDFEEKDVVLEGRFGADPLWVDGDATRLAQVVGNLLGNAAKFTPRGGRVEISVEREGAVAALRVRDTGAGITPEVMQRLFEPFMQAPQTLARAQGGLGLGLALVKGIVDLHGGTVDVASDGIGRGTEFTVRVPLETAPVKAAPPRPATTRLPARPRRVLVIEDNLDAAETLMALLELDGHEVRIALDGASGVAMAHEFRPEVVLCDIGLPGLSGYEVARQLRADEVVRGAVLAALTGYALPEDKQRALDAGFTHHITKPPSLEALGRVLGAER